MSKKLFVVMLLALLLVGAVMPEAAQEPVTVTWFVGLGTGTNSEQIEIQNQVVADFNAAHPDINLVINIAASNETARDTLSTLLAAGTPPEIVGPVGVAGSNAFADQWADVQPLAEAAGMDLSVFDPALVELYRTESGGLGGLPFAVFPAVTYYNEDLFDEAGLNYPPAEFGAPYVMPDGTEVAWDYATVAEIAKILTVDAAGNDATSADFDASAVEQYGINFQWARMRLMWTNLQPSDQYYDAEANTISVPEEWHEATQWIWDRIWVDHTFPNATAEASEVLQPSGFASGNLAMSIVPLWYTCCLDNSVGNFNWDIAPVPASLDGEQHVAMDADTFRIVESSANKDAAFVVLTYLVTEAAPALASAYGAYPAYPDARAPWVESISARYPMGVNWDVAAASLAFANPGTMHHESNVPNYAAVYDREFALLTLINGDTGVDLDLAEALDTFATEATAIVQGS
jgi:multiple sugar transport system substrate-binding protein